MRSTGAHLVFSSDLPGSDWSLFYGLHSAMTRQNKLGAPDGGWFPDQRMSAEEAVRGYSAWAAFASFDERSAGSVQVGKRADFTVISADPFRLTRPDDLLKATVRLTMVGGRVRAGSAAPPRSP